MSYQTGTVATPNALQVVIETFALANGYTLNAGAGSWLTKNDSHVRLGWNTLGVTTLTRSGTTATATTSLNPNGYIVGETVTIAGATDSGLWNGTFTITEIPSANQFRYILPGTPAASTATGTITHTPVTTYTNLRILGANSADGTTELCPNVQMIWIPQASWPVTYYLFYSGTPNQLTCVLHYDTDRIQVIAFGELVKVNNSAYVGGNWFYASKPVSFNYYPAIANIVDTTISIPYANSGGFPFPTTSSASIAKEDVIQLHCKIDSKIWTSGSSSSTPRTVFPSLTDATYSSVFRSPNTWNSQAHLVPMQIQVPMASSLYGYVGYIEHLRLVRVDNYEIGDIITLGSDTWKVYPWLRKDSTNRNGDGSTNPTTSQRSSGTLGFACRYVP